IALREVVLQPSLAVVILETLLLEEIAAESLLRNEVVAEGGVLVLPFRLQVPARREVIRHVGLETLQHPAVVEADQAGLLPGGLTQALPGETRREQLRGDDRLIRVAEQS